jgi:hypothetical protein
MLYVPCYAIFYSSYATFNASLETIFAFFEFCYLSEECSQWQQYQKLLQAHQQYSTVQEVHPAIYLGISFS